MKNVYLSKFLILVTLTIMLISPNFSYATGCNWNTIKTVSDGYLYDKYCHNKVGILVQNEKLYKSEIGSLREAIDLKDLTIKYLKTDSSMWEGEANNQFKRFENYRKAEQKRKWLYIGGGAAGALLLMFLANSASK